MTRRAAVVLLTGLFLASAQAARAGMSFRDVTKTAKVETDFDCDLPGGRMIATMGGGVAAGDYDGDGRLDLFFTGSVASGKKPQAGPCGTLFRNRGDGTFENATTGSGVRSCGWAMGASWVDVDSDGRPDLIVTGFDANRLWINNGDGTFHQVSIARGLDLGRHFVVGLAAGDIDGDGRVDLYFPGYLETTPEHEITLPLFEVRMPEDYPSQDAILFRQRSDGRFDDVTAAAGVSNRGGKGLGAVFFDYDGDGRDDLFVSNDRVTNRLYKNLGEGRFEDVTAETGAGAREQKPRAGMGIAIGDPFGSGLPSILVTNFCGEPNTLYRNIEGQLFDDATDESGTAAAASPWVKWGTHFVDFDDDGAVDLYSVGGHLVPRIVRWLASLFGDHPSSADAYAGSPNYEQPITLWRNTGSGRFEDVLRAGDLTTARLAARGSAVGDFDGDGRVDLAVASISDGAVLYRNETTPHGHSIEILPVAGPDKTTRLGTRIRVTSGGRVATQPFIVSPSYASGSWAPLHFGLGDAEVAEKVEIFLPGSDTPVRTFTDVAADRLYRWSGEGLVEARRFHP